MKKLFRNKKVLLALVVAGVIGLSAGTYAWFTQNITLGNQSAQMGRLHVDMTSMYDLDLVYEPGQSVDLGYDFVNPETFAGTPTIEAIVQISMAGATVDFWSDNDGNPIDGPKAQPIDANHVQFAIDETSMLALDYMRDDNGDLIFDDEGFPQFAYMWMKDSNAAAPTYYLVICSGASIELEADVNFVGSQMGNVYQGAVFHFPSEFKAGQVIELRDESWNVTESSVFDTFGVYLDDLDFATYNFPDAAGGGLSNMSSSVIATMARAWLQEMAAGLR